MARPITITAVNDAQIDTAQSKFGGASGLFDGSADYLQFNPGSDCTNGTGDITYEGWMYVGSPNNDVLFDMRPGSNGRWPALFGSNSQHGPWLWWNGARRVTHQTKLSSNTWHHLALVRSSGVWRIYLDGVASNQSYTDGGEIPSSSYSRIGANFNLGLDANGHIDEFRISATARYTSGFTPSTSAFENDTDTLLLVHMDGADGSTTFTDDNSSAGVTHEGAADLSVAATTTTTGLRIKQLDADLGSLFTPSITIRATRGGDVDLFVDTTFTSSGVRTRTADVTLDNIVNLSLQAQKIIAADSTVAATATLTADAEVAILFEADLASEFAQTASAIEYISDPTYPNNRPKTITTQGTWTFDTVEQKHGTACIKATDTTGQKYIQVDGDFQNVTGNTSDSFTLEFWYKVDSLINEAADAIVFDYTSNTQNYQLKITRVNNGTADFEFRTPGGTTLADVPNVSFAEDTWHHIVFRTKPYVDINTENLEVWIDSTQIYNIVEGNSELNGDDTGNERLRIYAYDENGPTTYVDSLSVRRAANSGAYIAFQGATNEPTNDEDDTLVLALFNENLDDSVTRTRLFASDLDSAATFTALGGANFESSATLASAATISTLAEKIAATSADFASAFDISATGEFKPLEFAADFESAAQITVAAGIVKTAQTNLNTTFSQTASFGIIRRIATNLNSAFAQNVTVSRTAGVDADLIANAAQTSDILRIRPLASDLGSLFTPSITIQAQMTGEVLCINTFTQTADTSRLRSGSADFEAFNTQISVAVVVASGAIDLASAVTQTASVDKFGGSQAVVDAEFAVSVAAGVIQQANSDLDSAFAISTTADTVKVSTVDVSSAFTTEIAAVKTTDAATDLSAFNTQITSAGRIASFILEPDSQFAATIDAARLRDTSILVGALTNVVAEVGRVHQGSSTMQSEFAVGATSANLITAGATLSSAGGFGLTVAVTASGGVDLDSVSTLAATALRTRDTSSQFNASAALTVASSVTRLAESDLNCEFDSVANGGTTVDTSAALAVVTTLSIGGNIIIVDRIIYTIPKDVRVWAVDSETRSHTLHKEIKAYTIEGER